MLVQNPLHQEGFPPGDDPNTMGNWTVHHSLLRALKWMGRGGGRGLEGMRSRGVGVGWEEEMGKRQRGEEEEGCSMWMRSWVGPKEQDASPIQFGADLARSWIFS